MSQSFALQSPSSSSTFSVKNAAKINTRRSSSKGQRGNQLRVKAEETSTSGVTSVVNDQTFEQDVLKSDVPVLVDFWAPWCGPCRMIAPLIDQLAEEYAGKLKAVKLNTDESPSIATEYGIRSIPTVMIFKDGKKMDTVIGAVPKKSFGDYNPDTHFAGWLKPKLESYMPAHLLLHKGKKNEKLLKEWEQLILDRYAKVAEFTSLEAKINYLDYVQEWTFYGSTFFQVEQRQFKDYPSPITMGINCEGVILMHPAKQTVLENYSFTDIVTWGHSDEKFIIVVGNIVQQRKFIFKTNHGQAMHYLIHDYVKFKLKNKQAI